MKKLTVYVLLFLFGALVNAQNRAVDQLFEKYGGKDGFTTVVISRKMFELAAKVEAEDDDAMDVISKLKSVRILAMDECEKPEGVNFYDEVMELLNEEEYEELMVVKEKDQDVKILIKEADGIITELLLIVGGEDNALISLVGEIDLKNVHELSKSIHSEHMVHLKDLKDAKL